MTRAACIAAGRNRARYVRVVRRVVVGVTVAVALAAVLGAFAIGRSGRRSSPSDGAGSSTSADATSTSTTTTGASQSPTALPVLNCPTSFGSDPLPAWQPQYLAAAIPASLKNRLAFYSNGLITVMAPAGETCSAGVGANGSMSLTVARSGDSAVAADTPTGGIRVVADYTGHGPGQSLVCGYFPESAAARADQPCDPPAGPVVRLTPDVVTFTTGTTKGLVVYPQVADDGDAGVNVDVLTCNAGDLCAPILMDALVRLAPTYTPPS